MIKAILSDLGNVAVLFDNAKTCRELSRLTGIAERDVHDVMFRKGSALFRRYERGAIDSPAFQRSICARLNLSKGEMPGDDAFYAAYADVFAANEPVLERWALLRKDGLMITAVSNIDEMRHRKLGELGLLSGFDHLVMSYLEGLRKPSAELMVRALDRTGVSAEEALFVDDLAENLAPAVRLGINVHHFTSAELLDVCLSSLGLVDPSS
ncbi:MAG TPA: HAD-IA family hydrolase [Candidatus Binatia bacterium]|jgi:FMN phosphatase YigB (HAD superfamily)|nr:HAD-IA family hydrolase [Candidatus Binatia bacterium]